MRKIKIIALFLLIFSFGFSEESSQEKSERITQLEQQIETQNKIIARYERLEDKLNDRVLETLDLNNKVDTFYSSAWDKLQIETDRKINWILGLVAAAFGVIGIIAIMPIYQSWTSRKIIKKLKEQEEKIEKSQWDIETQNKYLEIYTKEQHKKLSDQENKIVENLEELKKLKVQVELATLGVWNTFIKRSFDSLYIGHEKEEYIEISKEGFLRIMDAMSSSMRSLKNKENLVEIAVYGNLSWITYPIEKITNSILNENVKKEYEIKIIDTFQNEIKNFSEEYEYILDNLDNIFLSDQKNWTNNKKEILQKILKTRLK